MFTKIVALFALIAVAFAAPKPEPSPQVLAYSGVPLDYASAYGVYPGYGSIVSPYAAAAPLAYSAYPAYPGTNAFYVR